MRHLIFVFFALFLFLGNAQVFTYPQIPDSLVSVESRTKYLARHYWDCADLKDSSLFSKADRALDYIYLLKQQSPQEIEEDVNLLLSGLKDYEDNLSLWIWWMDHFLHDVQSPLCDNEMYLTISETIIKADIDEAYKIRSQWQLEWVRRNRVGHRAENFSFVDNDGTKRQLSDYKGRWTLILFHRISCELCHEVISKMNNSDVIKQLLKDKKLTVLAISSERDEKKMDSWVQGYENGEIENSKLYEIQQYPCFYLLNASHVVVLRQSVDLQHVIEILETELMGHHRSAYQAP